MSALAAQVAGAGQLVWRPLLPLPAVALFFGLWLLLCWFGIRRAGPARERPAGSKVTFGRRAALGLTLTLVLLGPSLPAQQAVGTTNVEFLFAIDRTGSMAAEDWDGQQPRLDGVRRDIELLVDAAAGARFAVITWDSAARLELPVTTDSSAVLALAEGLHQEISEFSAGSSLDRPVLEIAQVLEHARDSRPQNVRYLVLFSDGEDTDQAADGIGGTDGDSSEVWGKVAGLIDGGAVIGYGTAEGGHMRVYQAGDGQLEEYMTDPDAGGELAVSALDRGALEAAAEALGVPALINPTAEQVTGLGEELMAGSHLVEEERETFGAYQYVVWPLGLVGAALAAWELAAFAQAVVRLRRSHAL